MLENFNEDKRKNSMTQFSDFDSLLSPIFLRCSRTLRFHTGWSILITKDSKEVYYREGGASSIEQRKLVSKKTKFYIGSLTKQFTAIAILKLVMTGALKLSDSIQKHLPDFPVKKYKGNDTPITIEHLLTHISGLISIPGSYDLRNIIDLVKCKKISYHEVAYEFYKYYPIAFEPGTVFSYSILHPV